MRFDAFTDQYGASVSRDNGNILVSRLGVSLDHETKWTAANGKTQRSHLYGITTLYYDFLHGTSARVADISWSERSRRCGPAWAWVRDELG